MSFKIDNIVIDRVQMAIAEDTTPEHNFLYTLTQLSEPQIEINAESAEAKDANGVLIRKFYKGKTGTFTANSALIDFNILGATTGSGKEVASDTKKMTVPKIMYVKVPTGTAAPITLPDSTANSDVVLKSLKVASVAGNGTMLTKYKLGDGGFQFADGKLTLPTLSEQDKKDGATRFVIKYDRVLSDNAVAVKNRADRYPSTIRLTLKCLCIDPCDAGTLRAAYIVLPSFQVSPETTVEMKTDAQLAYKGDLQVDYCSDEKTLYEIYMAEDDTEEE